jgi:D-tagatose-1,6-bisphosphate aldolase subunit GatZ/KbaZ
MSSLLQAHLAKRKTGVRSGIYSVCSAHRWVIRAAERLFANLSSIAIPETMLSQYLPAQYERVRSGEIAADAESIIVNRIRDVLWMYALACA